MDKLTALKKYFGYSSFREGQEKIIDDILSGRDVLAVMPTGAGKSLCYQVPSLIGDGTAIVISPLISLMKDQISSLRENGINAATINSSLDKSQLDRVYTAAKNRKYKIIYVSPERLDTPAFRELVSCLDINFVCVDEAHCVSQWGQDFRSSYLLVSDFVASFEKRPVVAAFTATATDIVRDDICRLLCLENPVVTVTGFDRKNLFFEVQKPEDKFTALRKCLDSHSGKSSIVYCSTRKTVEEVCFRLCELGYNASKYHAGLTAEERKHNQDEFVSDRVKIMVATNAFGMGIDKSDVSLVVHYNMPGDIESYYQEAGRAGRDGLPADCVLLYSYRDVKIQEFLINNSPDNEYIDEKDAERFKRRRIKMLRAMETYCLSGVCLRNIILRYFGEKAASDCGNCSVCCGIKKYTNITIDAQKILSAVFRTKGKCTINELVSLLKGSDDRFAVIKTFGAMKENSEEYILKAINHLISYGFLSLDTTCGFVSNNPSADSVLFKGMRVQMEGESENIPGDGKTADKEEKPDLVLFAMLKVLRAETANRLSVPPLAVFTDSTLRQMSAKKPRDVSQMRKISGMSEKKIEKYAPVFLKEINAYLNK